MALKFPNKRRSPYAAKTGEQVLRLKSDNTELNGVSIYADNRDISLIVKGNQIDIPKATFDKLMSWYYKPQTIRKP